MVLKGKTECSPAEAGYNEAVLETLDAHCLDLIQKKTIVGASYALARGGKVFAHRAMGKMSFKQDAADFKPDTIRPIASTTKPFTAIAIMQLLEQGKLYLHQSVAGILSEFATRMHGDISVAQLLTHTSGLRSSPGTHMEPYPEERKDDWTKENWIKKILTGPLQSRPGTRWSYCSDAYCLLAEIVVRLSGMEYDEYVMERIIKPLGMDSTFFYLPPDKKDRVAVISRWNEWMCTRQKDEEAISARMGAGALFSTAWDLTLFGRMLLAGGTWNGKRILGRKSVETAVKAHAREAVTTNWRGDMFNDVYKVSWGLGFEVNKFPFLSEGTYDHDGMEGTLLFMDPKEDFVFAGFFPSEAWHGESWVSPLAIAWSGLV